MEKIIVKENTATLIESINKAISYDTYRTLVKNHVENKTNTGANQTSALAEYTFLNDRRMKRLDKTLKIAEDVENILTNTTKKITWLVITESWCGDAAQTIPVINKLAKLSENIDLKIVLRDENPVLMNQFLTNGAEAIPKLIAFDTEENEVVYTWGPRPSEATKMVNDFKEAYGKLTAEFKKDLQLWYTKDKGENTAKDIATLVGLENYM